MAKLYGALLLAACMTLTASAQKVSTDVAVTFSLEHGQVASQAKPTFWLKGGSADGAVSFYRGLGVAANLTGEASSDTGQGVSLSKLAFMVGPRYTFGVARGTHLFTEALFGVAHGFNSIFPAASGAQSSATSASMQFGGGIDVGLKRGFGIRALEVDYVRTTLPNNAANSQNDLRLAFGLSYHH